jgi:hypothetical protein
MKTKSEGGSGGKRGHSNMTHWDLTANVKRMSRKARRANDKTRSKERD